MIVWTALSRKLGKVVAFTIGNRRDCAYEQYCKTKEKVGSILCIYTDANSCYQESFKEHRIEERHVIAEFKNETHLIESTNSSLRDNLARFNRITKRYTKSEDMLNCTLKIFFYYKSFNTY